jgi:hypothetical protein
MLNLVLKLAVGAFWFWLSMYFGGPWWFALINGAMAANATYIEVRYA